MVVKRDCVIFFPCLIIRLILQSPDLYKQCRFDDTPRILLYKV